MTWPSGSWHAKAITTDPAPDNAMSDVKATPVSNDRISTFTEFHSNFTAYGAGAANKAFDAGMPGVSGTAVTVRMADASLGAQL